MAHGQARKSNASRSIRGADGKGRTPLGRAIEAHRDGGLRSRAPSHGMHLVEFQHGLVRDDLADGVEHGVDRAIAAGDADV